MENLINRLIKVQSNLKAPKNLRNNFGNYNYRSAESILEAVKPLLQAEGILLFISDRIEQVGERYYIKAVCSITDGKDTITTEAYARESMDKKGMDDAQITGACSSYARKYALGGMFLLDDTKDVDSNEFSLISELTKVRNATTIEELEIVYKQSKAKENPTFLASVKDQKNKLASAEQKKTK